VVLAKSSGGSGGFVLACTDCVGVVIDGSAKWSGAPAAKSYGIKITMTGNYAPSAFLMVNGLSRFVTIRGVEIDGAWPRSATNGIGIHIKDATKLATDYPGLWREGLLLEENYVHNVEGEGIYVGPNWKQQEILLKNVVIRNNVVEDTGWDGIQLKGAVEGTNLIHHNVVRRTGQRAGTEAGQRHGISLYEGNGKIFANWVESSGESGIQHYLHFMPSSYPVQNSEIFNNVVVDTGLVGPLKGYGITVGNQDGYARPFTSVYNNTIVRSQSSGVLVSSTAAGGIVRDNVIADAGAAPISSSSAIAKVNNRSGSIADMGFVDPTRKDFRLRESSPAVDSGTNGAPPDDIDGNKRPAGATADQGAYEFIGATEKKPEPPVIEVT